MNCSSNWQSVGVWALGAKLRSGFCRLKSCIKAFRHRRGVNLSVRFRRNLWNRFANPLLFFARKSRLSYMILEKSARFLTPRLPAESRIFWRDLSLDALKGRISSRKSGRRALRAQLNVQRRTLFRRAASGAGQDNRQTTRAERPATASFRKSVGGRSFRQILPAAPGNERHEGSEQPRIAKYDRLQRTAAKMIGGGHSRQGRLAGKAHHIFAVAGPLDHLRK